MGSYPTDVKPNGGSDASAVSLPVPPAKFPSSPVTATVPRSIDPHSLVHRPKLSKAMRALLGAEILDGRIPLMNVTREIVAKAVGCSAGYIDKARQLSPEQRCKVARGERSLIERNV
jgi:hypothetical protein